MAVDAALACMGDADPAGFDALSFASTSAPYLEKQVASVVATAVDLPRSAAAADFGGSARAGLAALRAACDAVRAGSLSRPLVTAADVRAALAPRSNDGVAGVGAAELVECLRRCDGNVTRAAVPAAARCNAG